MFVSYILQVKRQPFLARASVSRKFMKLSDKDTENLPQHIIDMVKRTANTKLTYVFNYNMLEESLLITSTLILLSGMIFDSAAFDVGSAPYVFLVVVVFFILFGSILAFVGLLSWEIFRAVKCVARGCGSCNPHAYAHDTHTHQVCHHSQEGPGV